MNRHPFARHADRPAPPTDLDHDAMQRYVVRTYGFDPSTVSATAQRYGIIEKGPRRGFLVVFTEDLHIDEHATRKRNFVDADRNYNPYNEDPAFLLYIFAPLGAAAA